jgi:hypothetical protein
MANKVCISEVELLQLLNKELETSPACTGVLIRRLNRIVSEAKNWEPDMTTESGPALTGDCRREVIAASIRLGAKYDLALDDD